MIPESQLKEIKTLLDKSENPLFLFDDDPDGICSFILLKRYAKKGKGTIIKSSPILTETYLRKIEEYRPDLVIILDKPVVEQDFIDQVHVPLIWLDHHEPVKQQGVKYYNPRIQDKGDKTPTTYWCYKITKKDLWIAGVGTISDWFIPDFYEELKKLYPDLFNSKKEPGEILFNTDFGKLARIFAFLTKGRTSEVNKHIHMLTQIETPYELLNQTTPKTKYLYKKAEKISKQYQELLEKAINTKPDKNILLFIYPSTKNSFTGELSNELIYKFPDKIVIVGRQKNEHIRMSLRSSKVLLPPILKKIFKEIPGYGGGHENACGAQIEKKDLNRFIKIIKKEITS